MNPKRLPLLLCALLVAFTALSQGSIKGFIRDRASGGNIEFATISLLKMPDSTLMETVTTDRKGRFAFKNVPAGVFRVQSTFIGFEKDIKTFSLQENQQLEVGTIQIVSEPATLSDVKVKSSRSLLNTSIDRKIYNVEQDIMAQTGSASDVLKNVPSVEVDIEGNISLRGSGDVLILINGRPSPLMGKSKAEVLQQMPANTIERIEVITNPSARYKPDGTSGIINIVLKKNTKKGWNGSIGGNASNRNRYNTNANMNYNPGKLNLFGTFSFRKDNRMRYGIIERTELLPIKTFYQETSRSAFKPLSFLGSLGIDYNLNENNILSVSGNFLKRKLILSEISERSYFDENRLLNASLTRTRYDPETELEKEFSASWQHNFEREDEELHIEINSSQDNETEDNHYSNIFTQPFSRPSFDNTLIRQTDNQQNITADYTLPLAEDEQIEAGYEGNFNQLDLDFYGEYFDTAQSKFIGDVTRTNQFLYKDFKHALYATYQKAFEKFSYSAGVRLEQVLLKGNLVTLDSLFKNNYLNIYPTLHLSYKPGENEIQLNYSRRVNRPDGDELNPFPEYRDPRNISAGNPKLLPEFIHSFEIGYSLQNKKYSFVPSLYYRYKRNGFTTTTLKINDSTFLTTLQNLSNDQAAGLELIFSAKDGKFISANISSNFFYNKIEAANLGYPQTKSIISFSTNLNTTFTLSKSTTLQVSSNIRSARLTPQGNSKGSIVLNSGLRQDFFRKKLTAIITASDIFKTFRQSSTLNTPSFYQQNVNKRDAQIIFVGLNYRFGASAKKQKEEAIQFDNGL